MPTSQTPLIDPLPRSGGLRGLVTDQLMRAIFMQKICAGDRLIVANVAQQLGTSASPVREALVELAGLGLVDLLPNRGAVCLPFGRRQLREIFDVRRVLEAEAARLACGRIPPRDLRDLRKRSQSLAEAKRSSADWSDRAAEVDIALHNLIAEYCDNHRLRHEIEGYAGMMRSIRLVAGNRRDIQLRAIEEHVKIIDALLKEQSEAAAKLMAEHLNGTTARLADLMFPETPDA